MRHKYEEKITKAEKKKEILKKENNFQKRNYLICTDQQQNQTLKLFKTQGELTSLCT